MLKIRESGMRFEVPKDKTFPIERLNTYQKVNIRGVSAVEFITMSPRDDVIFVEAKTTAPDKEDGEKLGDFIRSISRKFIHSLEISHTSLAKYRTEFSRCLAGSTEAKTLD